MNTMKECFEIILHGDKEESRQAARRIRKLTYSGSDKTKYADIKKQIDNARQDYHKITEEWRQENFVIAISVIYFLHDRQAEPDFLFAWLIDDLLEHKKGTIRYAAVRMLTLELGPLTAHVRIPGLERSGLRDIDPEKADKLLFRLYMVLNTIAARLEEPKHKRYKYVSSLPSSPYKSVQMVVSELIEYCGQEYIDQLIKRYHYHI